ncbi:MAG: ABC transporter permease, partial [Opitutae bacterium]
MLLLNMRRDLLWQFTKRNIQTGFRGSLLGVFWVVLSPLLMLALYTFVFGVVFGGSFEQLNTEGHLVRKDGASYALGIFLGLSVMSLISGTLSSSATLIVSNPNFVKKVVFPLEVLPVAQVGNLAFNFSISLGLCLIGAILVGDGFCMAWIWLPLIILPSVFISLGIGWLLASLGVFFRDIAQLTQFLGMVLLYASGVFYSVRKIPETY